MVLDGRGVLVRIHSVLPPEWVRGEGVMAKGCGMAGKCCPLG